MDNREKTFTPLCISVVVTLIAIILGQCSSSRKSTGVAIPDVSQIPTPSDSEAKKERAVVTINSPDFYPVRDTSRRYDSIPTKTNIIAPSSRIILFSATDFSVYDTPYDSGSNRAGAKTKVHGLDSTDYIKNVDVGILSPTDIQNLTLRLSKTDIVAISLVSKALYENFENENLEKKFTQYAAEYILVTVAKSDSKLRNAFAIQFYQERRSGKAVGKAFNNALDYVKRQNNLIDFKAKLIKNR